jgi:transposase
MEVRPTDQIKFRDDLYPRFKHDPALVQKYAQDLDILPPIKVNQNNELIDGFHRWTAYKTNEVEQIPVEVVQTATELEFLRLAIQANNRHGWQLTDSDKKSAAVKLYGDGTTGLSKDEIAKDLSVSVRSVQAYLSGIDRQIREERKQQIFELYMDCWTQREIAERVGIPRKSVDNIIQSLGQNGSVSDLAQSLDFDRDPDFKKPLYNIWNFAKLSNEVKHFGNSEQRIVDNLLRRFTQPFDIVVDPFAGGGSTLDVCRKRLRRCYASDRKPIPARADQIRQLDVVDSLPDLGKRWSDVSLTYLDPPYWKQAENKYSTDAEDLANMSLEQFTDNLVSVVEGIGSKQSKGVIALLIQPTQWLSDGRKVVDHVMDLVCAVNLELLTRVSCPYSTEQYNSRQVDWANENGEWLVLTRELIVWQV